jgi:hypothetical protein
MESELERYASATHDLGHDVVACVLKYDGTSAEGTGTTIVKIARDENIDCVFRNAMSQLAGHDLHCRDFLALTTVPNRAVARLMEALSESGEKAAAFLIAALLQSPGRMITTHLCWVNLSGEAGAVNDTMYRLMVEWNKLSHRSKSPSHEG